MFGFVFYYRIVCCCISLIVRFPGWQLILLWGVIEMLFAFFCLPITKQQFLFHRLFDDRKWIWMPELAFRARHIQRGTSIFELMRPLPVSFKKKSNATNREPTIFL